MIVSREEKEEEEERRRSSITCMPIYAYLAGQHPHCFVSIQMYRWAWWGCRALDFYETQYWNVTKSNFLN